MTPQKRQDTMNIRGDLIKALMRIERDILGLPIDKCAVITREERRKLWSDAYMQGAASGRLTPIEELDQ